MPANDAAVLTREIESRVQDLAREFLDLELAQMRKGEIEARRKIERAKKDISAKRKELKSRLSAATDAAPTAWDDTREGVEAAWEDLREAVDRARRDFAGEDVDEDEDGEEA